MLLCSSVLRAAQINAPGDATVFEGKRQSWSSFCNRVGKLASALIKAGVKPDDKIAILGLNSDAYLETHYAVWWVGAVIVPMNTRWSVPEIVWALNDSGADILFYDLAFQATAARLCATDKPQITYIRIGQVDDKSNHLFAETLIENQTWIDPYPRNPGDLAAIYYTGGTTGRPKGVMLSEAALWSSCMSAAHDFNLNQNTRCLHAAPIFHIAGATQAIAVTLMAGCHVCIGNFVPKEVLTCIHEERVTSTLLVPTMIRMLINDTEFDPNAASSLKTLIYGAAPMSQQTLMDVKHAFPNCHPAQGYGQTEIAALCAVVQDDEYGYDGSETELRPVGRASYCVNVKICDEEGAEVPRGTTGEIYVRGPNIMMGYWNNPQKTAETLIDGWVKTGDAGHMDDHGYIYISDRLKDMIITGGENVFSIEVEDILLSHPTVQEAAVIGVPDELYGERVHAIIVLKAGANATSDELFEHCRTMISGFKVPRSLEFRTDPLPLSPAGKILKTELRKPYWANRNRTVN